MNLVSILAIGLAAAALGIGAVWTQRLSARAERDFPPEGRFVDADGVRIHVVDRGAGTPVVLLHGAFGGSQDWTATGIADEIARNHRVLVFDRPGHGYSDRVPVGPQSPLEQARVLRAACRELGVERPLLVGFSWSGALVLAWALEWPDEISGVLTVNGVAYPWPGPTGTAYVLSSIPIVAPLLAYTLAAPLGNLTARASVEHAFEPAAVPESFDRSPLALSLRPAQFQIEAEDMRLLKPSVAIQSPRYGEIRVPLEILAGRGDVVALWDWHSERLHRTVAGSELTVVEGAGHQMLYSHSAAVVEALERLAGRSTPR